MRRRCLVKVDEKPGIFLKNGQSKSKGLNRSISDAGWGELILKIDYLAAKPGQIVIKVNPKHSSQECRNCGNIDKPNRDGVKFICVECGIANTPTLALQKRLEIEFWNWYAGTLVLPATECLNAQKISPRSKSFRGEGREPSQKGY